MINTGIQLGSAVAGGIGANRRQRKQHKYQKEYMDINQGYTRENMATNQGYTQQNMAKSQGYTQDNMHLQKQLDKQMWDETNYGAQVQHMRNAGLNVGLMYGMAGQGGITGSGGAPSGAMGAGGSGSGGGVPQAQSMDITQAALDSAMKAAQIDAVKAQTKKTEAEANKTEGVDTEEALARITDITQGVKNKQAEELLTKTKNRIETFNANIQEMSEEEILNRIGYETRKAEEEMNILMYEHSIAAGTAQNKIEIVKHELANIAIQGSLMKANTNLTNVEAAKKAEEITNMIQERVLAYSRDQQEWGKMSQKDKEIELQKEANKIKQQAVDTYGVQVSGEIIEKAVNLVAPIKGGVKKQMKQKYKDHDGGTVEHKQEWETQGKRTWGW